VNKTFLIILLLISLIFSTPTDITNYLKDRPDDKIDIAEVVLILAKDAFPETNIAGTLQFLDYASNRVDQLVKMTKASNPSKTLAEVRISALNSFMFRPGGWNRIKDNDYVVYSYDMEYEKGNRNEALFLPSLINQRQGTCSTLPVFWYIIADRLHWPANLVRIPFHIFVHYEGIKYSNIDPSVQGGYISTERYISENCITEDAIKNGVYLKPMSKKEVISTFLVNNAFYAVKNLKDLKSAEEYALIAVQLDPLNAEAWATLGSLQNNPALTEKAKLLGLPDAECKKRFEEKRRLWDETHK